MCHHGLVAAKPRADLCPPKQAVDYLGAREGAGPWQLLPFSHPHKLNRVIFKDLIHECKTTLHWQIQNKHDTTGVSITVRADL